MQPDGHDRAAVETNAYGASYRYTGVRLAGTDTHDLASTRLASTAITWRDTAGRVRAWQVDGATYSHTSGVLESEIVDPQGLVTRQQWPVSGRTTQVATSDGVATAQTSYGYTDGLEARIAVSTGRGTSATRRAR